MIRNFARGLVILGVFCLLVGASACSKKAVKGEGVEGAGGGPSPREMQFGEETGLQDVFFDFDKSDIRPDQVAAMDANAAWLNSNAGAKVQIEGHCDERGTEEYNMALGERRANSAKDYLVAKGVDAARIYTISYGENLPLDPGHTEAAWAKNRRDHFLVSR